MNPRATAVLVLSQVLAQGRSLTAALEQTLTDSTPDRALIQALCYGVMRQYPRLEAIVARLLRKPLKDKDADIQALLMLGIYQLTEMRIPDHAAVGETVSAVRALKKEWARGLVNGVLRNFQRQQANLCKQVEEGKAGRWSHPQWLIDHIEQAWPQDWQAILAANNRQAPMTLRINALRQGRDDYLQQLVQAGLAAYACPFSTSGIYLESAVDVGKLPGFHEGLVSVQDEAAQLAAGLLQLAPGQRVLDVCAAPGGKAAHILETEPGIDELQALDVDPQRLERVEQTLERLGLKAHLLAGDATSPADWWDGQTFDRILLDAPCSATGVIRRHPDIKYLRRPGDIAALVKLQGRILRAVWPLLKPGGILVYATCSVLPQENQLQMERFLQEETAKIIPMEVSWGRSSAIGRQILPGEGAGAHYGGMDGFYYTCLQKQS
jgi:16S rRNA (cytosine967-C5)-methyltransferase